MGNWCHAVIWPISSQSHVPLRCPSNYLRAYVCMYGTLAHSKMDGELTTTPSPGFDAVKRGSPSHLHEIVGAFHLTARPLVAKNGLQISRVHGAAAYPPWSPFPPWTCAIESSSTASKFGNRACQVVVDMSLTKGESGRQLH